MGIEEKTQPKSEATDRAPNILLVDDDAELCELISEYLTTRGFIVTTAADGAEGLKQAQDRAYALMVLDVMLPGMDGLEVLRRLRTGGAIGLPIIMLTAHGDEIDRIVGLELGADDYLPKPFNPRELLARIHAILRRAKNSVPVPLPPTENQDGLLRVADIQLDNKARAVRRNGQEIELTAIEFDLLHVLMCNAGRVVARDELSQEALQRRLLPFDRSLDMHISKLRRKLGPTPGGAERIKTIRGVGYIFTKEGAH
jgi:DNA-binding response OmpR family regulator